MEEQYTIDEILSAVNDLRNSKKDKKKEQILMRTPQRKKNSDIPSSTLKLIEEAENNM